MTRLTTGSRLRLVSSWRGTCLSFSVLMSLQFQGSLRNLVPKTLKV